MTSNRKSFNIPGLDHGDNPIPMASRVGPVFRTSGVMGKDPLTGGFPDDPHAEVALVFANLKSLLDAAQVALTDVVFVEVLISDPALRSRVNEHWVEWFPDPESRPARHTSVREMPHGMRCQLVVEAYSLA